MQKRRALVSEPVIAVTQPICRHHRKTPFESRKKLPRDLKWRQDGPSRPIVIRAVERTRL